MYDSRDHPAEPPTGCRARLTRVLVLGVLLVASASAQERDRKTTAERPSFEGRAEVVQVEVPVNVVTKSGEPVTGLTAADFTIYDRGERQELVGFDVINLGTLNAAEAEERIAELPSVARRHFLLLFDFSWSSSSSIVKARRAAHDFVLNALHPTDLVAIGTMSLEFGPNLLVTFTPDRAQLARAIDQLGLVRRPGQARIDPLRFMIATPPDSSAASLGGGETNERLMAEDVEALQLESSRVIGKQIERSELNYQRSRITAWSEDLGDLATALNSVAGRKHVIYFSEGFNSELLLGRRPDSSSDEFNQEMLDRTQGQLWMLHGDDLYGSSSLQKDIGDMLNQFRRADCIVQAIDVAGLRAEVGQGGNRGRSKGSDALFYMANETGGELFEASNNLTSQLSQVLSRSQVTYVLSFQPGKLDLDGSYHKIKVEVNAPRGTRVSHRSGYYEPRPFDGLHPLEKTLLASDAIASAAPRREIGIDVLAAPFRAGPDLAYLPVILEIRGEDLLRGHDRRTLNIEIYGYITNAQGEMRDFFSQSATFDVDLLGGKIRGSGVKYYSNMELTPGEYLLRVLVRNADNGRTGVETAQVSVPRYEETGPTLLPPLFKDDPVDKWLLIRDRGGESRETVVYPFTVKGEPFVPTARPVLGREKVEVCLVTYNLGAGRPDLESWILDATGTLQEPGELKLLERTVTGISGQDKLLASFLPPRGLPSGDYTLEVAVTDPASGSRQRESILFSVPR